MLFSCWRSKDWNHHSQPMRFFEVYYRDGWYSADGYRRVFCRSKPAREGAKGLKSRCLILRFREQARFHKSPGHPVRLSAAQLRTSAKGYSSSAAYPGIVRALSLVNSGTLIPHKNRVSRSAVGTEPVCCSCLWINSPHNCAKFSSTSAGSSGAGGSRATWP